MIRFPFSRPKPGEATGGDDHGAGDDAALAERSPEEIEAEEARLDEAFFSRREDDEAQVETVTLGGDFDDMEDGGALGEEGRNAAESEGGGFGGALDSTPMAEQVRMVEAMLFASEKPLSTAELASRMPLGCDAAVAVRRLEEMYAGRGVALARVAGKWAFRTAPDLAHLLTGEAVEQRKLSRAAVETLAIVAYHQPVTRAEIEEIRQVGVSKGTLDLLMELEWIKLGRRRQTPGRPVTFVTTERFLEHFGLESLKDLPRLEELRQSGLLDSTPPKGFSPKLGAEEGEDEDSEEELDYDDEDESSQEDFLV